MDFEKEMWKLQKEVWKHRFVRRMAVRMHTNGVEENNAIGCACGLADAAWNKHEDDVGFSAEVAADAEYEALPDDDE